jgi:2-alkenal reductase
MSNRSDLGWLVALVFLGVLVGVIAGGLMGGIAGYYAAMSTATVAAPLVPSQPPPPTPSTPPIVTNLTVNENSAIVDAVKKVGPAVVTIITTPQHPSTLFGQTSPVASGSGVIIDMQGHIVTNNHVVEGASRIDVIMKDGSRVEASLTGTDPVTDLAVIRVTGTVSGTAPLGDSASLRLGETVLTIGSPLGSYRGSVTLGIVSGLNRSVSGTMQEGMIQSDAAINDGNDGGPLVNLLGQVVGINTLLVRDTSSGAVAERLGFALPSNTVREVSQQIIASGKVEYPYIGIRYQPITPQLARENNLPSRQGLVLLLVTPGSPASDAGLRQGDILLEFDGNKVDENHSFRSILFTHHAGEFITLTIMRDGQTSTVKIALAERPPGSTAV